MQEELSPLQFENVSKVYSPGSTQEYTALSGITHSIEKCGVYGLIGPNGAGKTTLLRIISNIIHPTSGTVKVFGRDITANQLDCKRRIGFIASTTGLYGRLTPRETLRYFGELFEIGVAETDRRIADLSATFGLEEFLDRKNELLSFGQKQRVNIARCMLHDPDIFVFDEITEGLDVLTSQTVVKFIQYLGAQGKCVLLSTHDMHLADRLCSDIIILHKGRIIEAGGLNDVKKKHGFDGKNIEDLFVSLI